MILDPYKKDVLVGQIRSGYIFIGRKIRLKPMSIDIYNESMLIYQDAYEEAISQELMTLEDSFNFLESCGVYTPEDHISVKNFEKELEETQQELYQNRKRDTQLKKLKKKVDSIKNSLSKISAKKFSLYENTCEFYSETRRLFWLLPRLLDSPKLSNKYSPKYLQSLYHQSILSEGIIRELCRNDPWRSLWILRKHKKLFYNTQYELNFNQKNMLLWSTTYDNIRQSLDSPEEKFYDDDYVIDSWFVWSRKNQEAEKNKQEVEKRLSSSKMANADSVFIMADEEGGLSTKDIYDLNEGSAKVFAEQFIKEAQSITSPQQMHKMQSYKTRNLANK